MCHGTSVARIFSTRLDCSVWGMGINELLQLILINYGIVDDIDWKTSVDEQSLMEEMLSFQPR